MHKRITVILETASDDEYMLSDEFIENDIKTELNCASNFYVVMDLKTEEIEDES